MIVHLLSCLNVKFTTADLKGLCHEIRSSSFSHFFTPIQMLKKKYSQYGFDFAKIYAQKIAHAWTQRHTEESLPCILELKKNLSRGKHVAKNLVTLSLQRERDF